MQSTKYVFKWDDKGRPVIMIDFGDDFAEMQSEKNLIAVIGKVKSQRTLYASQEAWQKVLDVYQGALDYLRLQMEFARR